MMLLYGIDSEEPQLLNYQPWAAAMWYLDEQALFLFFTFLTFFWFNS